MPWVVQTSLVLPSFPSEAWAVVFFPAPRSAYLQWGVRVPITLPVPDTWDFAGRYLVGCVSEGAVIYGPVRQLHGLGRGSQQGITALQREDYPLYDVTVNGFFLAVSVHRWVPRTLMELWCLM